MNINWREKLSSRKLWAAVGSFVTALLTSFGVGESVIARAALIIAGIGSLCVYVFAEARVDAARASADTYIMEDPEDGQETPKY